ncbi:class I SAM-dependent DNA methyltransferase [Pseudoxanthomonas spadix]|uniref:SAM-dependent methyltransferase n=1 Tax=Pseudoxanthomonas spadix (strain BD-a59) TaxID=1045855 RepID=G7UQN0_PSEUP|nr:class I SAM-dependent methyltransferase [Pseudoxanthomonas spadix]AER55762.1 SAM-dependent methyltransferase [Pseudoxanthomonas spadix BD-a59]MBP3973534.1 methyltransferase domain-containing protein [Pseudoxanthomonas spadix]RMW94917.1 methyltransferase domain-containing protein [Pseudoxanthomonas spadix]
MNADPHGALARQLDAMHAQDDPFGYRTRWYEARKRQVLLATLPHPHFERAWEIGCSNGELTAALSPRCSHLLATDLSANAVRQARARNAGDPVVQVQQAQHPAQWPDGRFDLIVLSEVGYYMPPQALQEVAGRIAGSLTAHGLLVACHWLHPFQGAYQHGAQVHGVLAAGVPLPRVYRYQDPDFLLEGWSAMPQSIAQREGLR